MADLPYGADAQVLYGSLTGNVADKTGAAVPNADVDATNFGTGISKKTKTDDRSAFLFQDVQAGTYKVTISAPGFVTTIESGVQIVNFSWTNSARPRFASKPARAGSNSRALRNCATASSNLPCSASAAQRLLCASTYPGLVATRHTPGLPVQFPS